MKKALQQHYYKLPQGAEGWSELAAGITHLAPSVRGMHWKARPVPLDVGKKGCACAHIQNQTGTSVCVCFIPSNNSIEQLNIERDIAQSCMLPRVQISCSAAFCYFPSTQSSNALTIADQDSVKSHQLLRYQKKKNGRKKNVEASLRQRVFWECGLSHVSAQHGFP